MHILEDGILDDSEIYFLQPSDFALNTLFCLQHIGILHCDSRYEVTHPYWESILFIFIDEGELITDYHGQHFTARKDDIIVINCRHEHRYRAKDDLRFHYFHFTGPCSLGYSSLLHSLYEGALIPGACSEVLQNVFNKTLNLALSQIRAQNEHRISVYLGMILCELVETHFNSTSSDDNPVEQAVSFMKEHLTQNLSLDELASHVGLSKYYFNRLFNKQMGMTPHRYFTNLRIQYSKRLLLTTTCSIEEVADECGFDSPSNFIRLFKQRTDMTPTAFRKIPF
jgi:AraC family transcriptional regulator